MAVTATPIFAQTPVSLLAAINVTANTSRAVSTGIPTSGVLISPSTNTNGVRVDQFIIQGTGTTIAGQVVIWLYDGTNGFPILELPITAVTPSTTTGAFYSLTTVTSFVLAPSYKLYATSQVASQVAVIGMNGGAY
jgi:hypothetical protein